MSPKGDSRRPGGPRRGNLAIQAAAVLRAMILRGELEVGQPLRELEQCAALGISRVPLREALHRLEAEGLVSIRPNRGAVVVGLSPADVMEIGELCRMLEPHVLRAAAPALTPPVLERAEACMQRLDTIEDAAEWARENWRFHETLYAEAGRPLQLGILSGLRARAERAMLRLVESPERRRRLNGEHRAILAALRAGAHERAAELLDEHLRGGRDEALRLLAPD